MNAFDLLESFDLSGISRYLDKQQGMQSVDFGELVVHMMSGKADFDWQVLLRSIRQAVFYGINDGRNLFVSLLLLGIVGVVLNNASGLFAGTQSVSLVKYFILLLMALSLFQGFEVAQDICQRTLTTASDFMKILLPTLCLSLGFTNGSITAYGYYQFVFFLIFVIQNILLVCFIPLAKCYAFMAFMNGLSEEKRFRGMMKLLEKGMMLGMKGFVFITIGSGMLHSVLASNADNLNKTVVQKTMAAIPGIGDVTDSAAEVLLSCAVLIKSSLGVAALAALLFLCLVPLIRLLVIYLSLRLSAVLLEVLGEKEMTSYIEEVGRGHLFLFQITMFTLVLFILAIAMVLNLFQGG